MKKTTTIYQITYCAILCALLCVSAYISFPIPIAPVKFTMQPVVVIIIGALLDRKHTAFTILTYILLGLVGLPVFSSGGGLGYVFTPSFGYLIGFLFGAMALSSIYRSKAIKNKVLRYSIGVLALIAIIYVIGVSYMYVILNFYMGSAMNASDAIYKGALIFLPLDVLKAVIAYFIIIALEKVVKKI